MSFTLDMEKVRALAKSGHVRCHGNGVSGYTQGGTAANVCSCVRRALEKQGVNVRSGKAVREALGAEEKVVEAAVKPVEEVGA